MRELQRPPRPVAAAADHHERRGEAQHFEITLQPCGVPAVTAGAPWRLLVLDADPADPKWIIATVALPADVRPATMAEGGRRYEGWAGTAQWVREQVGRPVRLVPISGMVWRVNEQPGQEKPKQGATERNGS